MMSRTVRATNIPTSFERNKASGTVTISRLKTPTQEVRQPQIPQSRKRTAEESITLKESAAQEVQEKETSDKFQRWTPVDCPKKCCVTPENITEHVPAILYHLERIKEHSKPMHAIWMGRQLGEKDQNKEIRKQSKEAAVSYSRGFFKKFSSSIDSPEGRKRAMEIEYENLCKHCPVLKTLVPQSGTFSSEEETKYQQWRKLRVLPKKKKDYELAEKYIPLMCLAVQQDDQRNAELYCLGLFEKKKLKEKVPEDQLKIMREKEYNHFRVHAAGMKASAQQSEKVSTAEDKERFQVREDLKPLPENRNDKIFDSYIPLAYLVAELKHQRDVRRPGYEKDKMSLDNMHKMLEEVYNELPGLINAHQKEIAPNAELDLLPPFKSVMNKDEPHIADWIKAIAEDVEKELEAKIQARESKTGKTLTEEQIDKMRSSSKASLLSRKRDEMCRCSYDVFYEHGRQVRERIKSIEASYPPAKRQRVEVPVEEETNVEYETPNLQRFNTKLENLDRCRNILEDLENKLMDNKLPLTYDLLSNILNKDVHRLLEYFVMDLNFTVNAAVQELTGAAINAPPVNSQDTCVILSALKDPDFVIHHIFDPLDIMRRSSSASGYAILQADPEEPGSGNDYGNATTLQETSIVTNHCLQEEDVNDEVSGNPSQWALTDAEIVSLKRKKTIGEQSSSSAKSSFEEEGRRQGVDRRDAFQARRPTWEVRPKRLSKKPDEASYGRLVNHIKPSKNEDKKFDEVVTMLSDMFDAPALIFTRRYHWFRQQLNKITTETEHEDAAKFYDSMYGIDLEGLMVYHSRWEWRTILLKRYPVVFPAGLEQRTMEKAEQQLGYNMRPKYYLPHPVPYTAREAVGKKLQRLQYLEVIEPFKHSQMKTEEQADRGTERRSQLSLYGNYYQLAPDPNACSTSPGQRGPQASRQFPMSLFGQIASLEDIVKRLPQLQIQVEKLEEEESSLERGGTRGSFNRRYQDLAKLVTEQRHKLDQTRGGNESTRAAATISLNDLQRRLYIMAPDKTSTSRSSAASADLSSQQEAGFSSSSKTPKLGSTRRPSMYDNYSSSSDDEDRKDDKVLPAVTEADESGSGSPPTPAPRKTESKAAVNSHPPQTVLAQPKTSSIDDESPIPRLPRSSSPGVVDGNKFIVLADMDAVEDGDLSIRKGQILTITMTRADGWWKALNQYGEEGMVPKTYLTHVMTEELRVSEPKGPTEQRRKPTVQREQKPQQPARRADAEDRQLEAERREIEEKRRELDEVKRKLETDKRSQQRELLRQLEEEKERIKEEHMQVLLAQRKGQIEESSRPRPVSRQPLPLKVPVTCLGDALRSDSHLTYQCHLTPRLSHSNLAFHDLFWNFEDDKLRKRRVTVCRIVRLVRLESMPNVEFGLIRVALYDQSKKTGRQIVSNVHTIRATVKNGTWSFGTRTDTVSSGIDLGDFILRSNYRMVDVVMLIEASIVEQYQGGFREKSVGIVKVPIMGNNGESCLINKTYSDSLTDENVFQKGTDVKKINGKIYFKVLALSNDMIPHVDSMPDVLIFNPMFLKQIYFYRRRAGSVLIRDRDNPMNAEMVSDPLLAVFPAIADQPDLMDLLRTMWTSKIKGQKTRSETEQAMDFFQVFMNTVFCIHKTAIMPDYCIWDKNGLQERQKIFMKCVEILREYKTSSRFLLTIASQPINIYDYSFDLLGPHALD